MAVSGDTIESIGAATIGISKEYASMFQRRSTDSGSRVRRCGATATSSKGSRRAPLGQPDHDVAHEDSPSRRGAPPQSAGPPRRGSAPVVVGRLDRHLDVVGWLSLRPAAVIRTKRPFWCSCGMESAPLYPMAARRPPINWWATTDNFPGMGPALDTLRDEFVVGEHIVLEVPVLRVRLGLTAALHGTGDPIPRYCLNCLPLTNTTSPGDSSHPARSDPSMTVSAPATMAFACHRCTADRRQR